MKHILLEVPVFTSVIKMLMSAFSSMILFAPLEFVECMLCQF